MNTSFYKFLFIILSILPGFYAGAQDNLDLNSCRKLARDNYPKLNQSELMQEISRLKVANNKTAYLPQIDLKGQATYQSDVTSIDLDLSKFGMKIPSISKDQYKVYLDVKQTIWDGGMTNSRNLLENASLESDIQKLDVEEYQLNGLVDSWFFNLLLVRQNEQVLAKQVEVLDKQVEKLTNASKEGAARQKDVEKLEAEKLLLEQKQLELSSKRESIVAIVGILTGKELSKDVIPVFPEDQLSTEEGLFRPEFKLYELQKNQLKANDKLLSASRNPIIYGFGQAGYGRPGLNMLSNNFDPYYMVGIGVSWHVLDWQNTHRNKKINNLQRDVIGTLQSDFEQKQKIQLTDARAQISNMKQLLSSDEEIVNLRKKITFRSASELENGITTSTDYLSDLNAETVALINLEIHKIQLIQATINYNNILGK
jgi:outer membrane protein TolC